MKYFLLVSVLTLISFAVHSSANPSYELFAVSNEEIAEALYRRLRHQNPHVGAPPEMNQNDKSQICQSIARSDYFSEVLKEEWVNMEENYHDIRLKEPDAFKRLYEITHVGHDITVCVNPIKPVNVFVTEEKNEVFSDHVFTCLTLDVHHGVETYFLYFISREYNLSDTSDTTSSSKITGRFIFGFFNMDYDVKVLAVAEKPATTSPFISNTNAHLLYIYEKTMRRNSFLVARNQPEDYVCRLSPPERLRVWTIVLSSAYFKGKLKFVPEYAYIDPYLCSEMEVVTEGILPEPSNINPNERKQPYKEWVIGCRVTPNSDTNFQSEYFLSRVNLVNNHVYVYHRGQNPDTVVVVNMFHEVRFRI